VAEHIVKPAKLLICLVGRGKGEELVEVAKKAGARGGTISLGRWVSGSKIMQALFLADIWQEIVFTLLGPEIGKVLPALREAAAKRPGRLGGMAMLLNVPSLILRQGQQESRNSGNAGNDGGEAQSGQHELAGQSGQSGAAGGETSLTDTQNTDSRSDKMESGHKLITVIVNTGFADDVMKAAREAGATGGTILNARGTGTEDDVKFFGITLVPEKEMLYIVAAADKAPGIVEAVGAVPKLCEPGGGIIFCTDVEEFIILGK
jgi:nitrogen regulatory protein PII